MSNADEGREPTREQILEAAVHLMVREVSVPPDVPRLAEELGCDVEAITRHFETPETLAREAAIWTFSSVGERVANEVAPARDGADALSRFVSSYVYHFLEHLDGFRLGLMMRQLFGDERFGLTPDIVRERLVPHVNAPLDRVEQLLAADRGSGELPGGVDPRRLAFVGFLASVGLVSIRGLTFRIGVELRHRDDALINETSRALGGVISSIRQLSALNDVATEIAGMRTERDLLEAIPRLLTAGLDLEAAGLSMVGDAGDLDDDDALAQRALGAAGAVLDTGRDEPPRVAAPVLVDGKPAGVVHGRLPVRPHGADERDLRRLETFATMVGLGLSNVRLYEGLQTKVDERTRELRDAQAALVQSEKMASLGDLVAGIAHEINTPIASVLSSQQTLSRAVERLRAELGEGANVDKVLSVADQASDNVAVGAQRVADIVKQLRRFSRLDTAERDRARVDRLLSDTLAIARHGLSDDCRIETDLPPMPELECFPGQLNQLFLNLLKNAAEALEGPGTLRVSCEVLEDGQQRVRIADDGVGIAAEHLPRVFDPGFTTKGVGVGTGLGLSICYQIARDHGGRIEIESEPGRGTEVSLTLPTSVPA